MHKFTTTIIGRLPLGRMPEWLSAFLVYRVAGLKPISGGDGSEGDGGGGSGGEGGGEGGGSGSGDGGEGAGGDGGEGGSGDGDGEGADGGEWDPPDRKAWDNTQRQLREEREARAKLEREQEERRRKAAEDAGKFEDLYKEEERKRRELEDQVAGEQRQRRGTAIAARLNYRDPSDAIRLLTNDDLADDSTAERALKALAKEKPYLVSTGDQRTQRDLGSGDGGRSASASENGNEPVGPARIAKAYDQAGS